LLPLSDELDDHDDDADEEEDDELEQVNDKTIFVSYFFLRDVNSQQHG